MDFSINNQFFNHILKSGSHYNINKIEFIVSNCEKFCLGFVVPKSMGAANKRNRFRRRCKNSYELLKRSGFPMGIIVKPKSLNIEFNKIYSSFN